MKPIEFNEQNCVYAKDQPEYTPLPVFKNEEGDVISCWELSDDEIKQIVESKKLWISVKTFNKPLQPIFCTVIKDDILEPSNI